MGYANPFIQDILASNSSRIHSHSKGNIMYTKKDMEQMLYDLLEDLVDKEQPHIIEESKEEPLTEYQKELLQSISEDIGDSEENLIPIKKQLRNYAKAIEDGEEELDTEKLQKFVGRINQIIKNNKKLSPQRAKQLEEIVKQLEDRNINVDKLFDISNLIHRYNEKRFQFNPNNSNISPEEAEKRFDIIRQYI